MANRKIAYTLDRGRAYIFDMSSTSRYMGEKYFQEFGPRFFDMSSASGYMGEKYFQEFGPRFLACHVIFGVSFACHGVSISIVSIISVSCRVRILRVSMFMPCHGHPDNTDAQAQARPIQEFGNLEIWDPKKSPNRKFSKSKSVSPKMLARSRLVEQNTPDLFSDHFRPVLP